MALITCPECDHRVSDKAAACPECGAPIGKPQRVVRAGARWEGLGAVGVIVGILLFAFARSHGYSMLGTVVAIAGFVCFIIGRLL